MKSKFYNIFDNSIYIEVKPCPKCSSRKLHIEGGEIALFLGIKRTDAYICCEQCGHKGKIGHTNTSAIAYWNEED